MPDDQTQLDYKAPLRNCWYYVMPSHRLKAGKMYGRVILGEPIVFGRTDDGQIFGLRDICPHRALPLSCGQFDGKDNRFTGSPNYDAVSLKSFDDRTFIAVNKKGGKVKKNMDTMRLELTKRKAK